MPVKRGPDAVSFDGNQTITSRGIVYALTADNADPRNKNRSVTTLIVDGTTGALAADLTDAKLTNLVLSTGTLSPAFASAKADYTATVSNATASVTVTPTASSSVAKVRVAGTAVTAGTASALAVGANAIKVRVAAQDGVTIINYTVTVTRSAP
ncbi:MAG TPA: cadherin-like beta sandwich domain-containing protein [Opitutus sp.]|nr:cadherin-like beta sandwich domain-containing protein [Opitutus sp.]